MSPKNTISRWISTVIRRAYQPDSHEHQTFHGVSAHEVRALATSWRFAHSMSLEEVMNAASWRSNSTFSSFYLRDVSRISGDLHALGPLVAAQGIVV